MLIMNKQLIPILFACVFARHIPDFNSCASPSGEILSVDIDPCSPISGRSGSCYLQQNTTVKFSLDFKTRVNTTKVQPVVHGIIPSFPVYSLIDGESGILLSFLEKDACAYNNIDYCILKSGETVHYSKSLFINPFYPLVRVEIKFEKRDDHNQDLACLMIPTEIIN